MDTVPSVSPTTRVYRTSAHSAPKCTSPRQVDINQAVADDLNLVTGQQVALTHLETGCTAAYEVATLYETETSPLRMNDDGRARIGLTEPASIAVRTTVPHPDLSPTQAWRYDELTETVWQDPPADSVLLLAPHGGDIEANTDETAVWCHKHLPEAISSTVYMVQGFGDDAFDHWHISSTDMALASYPKLQALDAQRGGYPYAVAFHIHTDADVIVGGRLPAIDRDRIAARLREAFCTEANYTLPGDVVTNADHHMARSKTNVVNRLTQDDASSFQVSLPPSVAQRKRKLVGQTLANAIADYLFPLATGGQDPP